MAHSLASSGTGASAQIIPLPGAAAQPVRQMNGPGRRPLKIVNMFYWKTCRNVNRRLSEEAQGEEASLRSVIAFTERLLHQSRYELAVLTQAGQGSRTHV